MTILLLAEHNHSALAPVTAKAVSAALQLGAEVHVLVAGSGSKPAAEAAARIAGVAKVLHADAAHYAYALAEEMAPLIASLALAYSHIVAAATTTGKDILPRVAALLDVPMVSEAVAIHSATTFTRPVYAGNALETVQVEGAPVVLSIRGAAFQPAKETPTPAPIQAISATPPVGKTTYVSHEAAGGDRPELTAARVVVSGGRGMGSAAEFKQLEPLADKLGAALGASRAAVDAGFAPNDWQVGQTGKIVAPELYIAVGISGAIQHVAGMKDSRVIVAINKDENAPIFEVADIGLVAEWQQALPELLGLL